MRKNCHDEENTPNGNKHRNAQINDHPFARQNSGLLPALPENGDGFFVRGARGNFTNDRNRRFSRGSNRWRFVDLRQFSRKYKIEKYLRKKTMLKTTISILIAILFFQLHLVAPIAAQNLSREAETAKIKAALTKRGAGEKSKIKIKLRDGRELKGYIAALNTDDFAIADSKTNDRTTILYADVASVKNNKLSLGAKLGIAALVVGAVAAIVIAAGVKNLDDNILPN
jgi:hypothetical protein